MEWMVSDYPGVFIPVQCWWGAGWVADKRREQRRYYCWLRLTTDLLTATYGLLRMHK